MKTSFRRQKEKVSQVRVGWSCYRTDFPGVDELRMWTRDICRALPLLLHRDESVASNGLKRMD
jgi:hypothetical protein